MLPIYHIWQFCCFTALSVTREAYTFAIGGGIRRGGGVVERVPSCGLRGGGGMCLPEVGTVKFGEGAVRFLGRGLWRTLPAGMGESESLSVFEGGVETYAVGCGCGMCGRCVEDLGCI